MARAEAAHASIRSDSIKGLAQSIAKPAYRRLLTAEPALRRAVPALIIAFLLTICVGAFVQILDHRRQTIAELSRQLEASADVLAERIDRARGGKSDFDRRLQSELDNLLPGWARSPNRRLLVTNADGVIIAGLRHVYVSNPDGAFVASEPLEAGMIGRRLVDVLGAGQPLTTFGAAAGVMEIPLADGAAAFVTVRHLYSGELALIHSRAAALASWRSDTALTMTLSATTGFVVLILGFAFHWQATRAREADQIYETVRTRIDTALNRGRCGLWDWDLARGRIFWSHSMFAILGLEPRDDLLSFGEVDALVHPDDLHLYQLAAQLADSTANFIDHDFRVQHANGNWVWLRARCEIVHQPQDGGPHLIGIAVDITEQKTLIEKTMEADLRLRDAIETIPEAFVVWDAHNRLVLCNSNFQELHNLSDQAIEAGASYDAVVAAGRKPVVRSKVTSEGQAPGARTFEAQLDDGRWLHISERRTKDGGYVSVGTDITTIKLHEEKLMESEKRLIKTVADLRGSQLTLERQAEELADLADKYAEDEFPDEIVMVGGHRDGWGPGASDNVSGTVSVLEAARAVSDAMKAGHRPKRTIIFATWDAEEWGLMGSSEYVEDDSLRLMRGGVAYLNQDVAASGVRFGGGGSPSLRATLRDIARSVPDPSGKGSVYAEWRRYSTVADTAEPAMGDPGGGSDFAGFYNHLGMPIAEWGFGGAGGVYHSQYDDFTWMTKFGDSTFAYHATAARIGAAMLLRLANADILPYDYVEFARTMQRYLPALDRSLGAKKWSGSTAGLRAAIARMEQEASAFSSARDAALAVGVPSRERRLAVNTALLQVERALARPQGLRTRPWYRNLIYVADEDNGYANMVFPSVNEAIRANDESLTASELTDLAQRFDQATRALATARAALTS